MIFPWFTVVSWEKINPKRFDEVYAKNSCVRRIQPKQNIMELHFTFDKLRHASTDKIGWRNRVTLCKFFTSTFLLGDPKKKKNSKMTDGVSKCIPKRNGKVLDKICSVKLTEAHFDMCRSACMWNIWEGAVFRFFSTQICRLRLFTYNLDEHKISSHRALIHLILMEPLRIDSLQLTGFLLY